MRIIHAADWHLGHSLNGWGREQEHALYFQRLAEVIAREEADLLLVAGDVFDNSNPSGEVQELFYSALAMFKSRRPGLTTIISGGNHDPAQRLEAPSVVLKALDVHVVATVRRQAGQIDISRHLFPVKGADGKVALYVLAVPFLRASDLTGLSFDQADAQSPVVAAAQRFYAQIVVKAQEIAQGLPLIATSHLHCAGGLESEGAERRILIGGAHALPVDVFPQGLAYVALGHLHQQQSLAGGRVRYAGACFPLSASEIHYSHGVTRLDLIDGTLSVPLHLPITPPAPVLRLPRSGALSLAALPEALAEVSYEPDTPMGLRPLVYLELEATDAAAVLMTDAAKLVQERGLRLAGMRVRRPKLADTAEPLACATTLSETTPEQLFLQAYEAKNGIPPEERHLAAFRDILAEV